MQNFSKKEIHRYTLLNKMNLNELIKKENYIFIYLEPLLSLEETAEKINKIWTSIRLEVTDRYNEIPSYIYETEDFDFVLFGIPDEEHQLNEDAPQKYQFKISPDSDKPIDELIDASEEFSKIFEKELKIKCSA